MLAFAQRHGLPLSVELTTGKRHAGHLTGRSTHVGQRTFRLRNGTPILFSEVAWIGFDLPDLPPASRPT